MLFATTSNGVYRCDFTNKQADRVPTNRAISKLSKPEARGFFGIARHSPTGAVLVAARDRGFFRANRLANRVRLYLIDPVTLDVTEWAMVEDVHDVHQIAWHDGRVFLTDTGKNRIVVYAPESGERRVVNVGAVRSDVNHINSLLVHGGDLYVGLSNRGVAPAALLRVSLGALYDALDGGEPDLLHIAEHRLLGGKLYTHDLEPDADGRLFFCVSYDGCVFGVADPRPFLKVGGWTRGLAFGPSGVWVGTSELASREERHSEKLDGAISYYALPGSKLLGRLVLHKAGQVNDLLYVQNPRLPTSGDEGKRGC